MDLCVLNLRPQDAFERDCVSGELRDPFPQLLDRHLVFVEVEAVQRLVVEVVALGDVEGLGVLGVELLRYFLGGVV